MLIEENRYINDYYGIMRDIFLKKNEVEIIFNAFLNDELNLTFKKKYSSEDKARKEVEKFIKESESLKDELSYNIKTVKLINKSIYRLISDILEDKVSLPSKDYKYLGDKNYLRAIIDKKVEFVSYE